MKKITFLTLFFLVFGLFSSVFADPVLITGNSSNRILNRPDSNSAVIQTDTLAAIAAKSGRKLESVMVTIQKPSGTLTLAPYDAIFFPLSNTHIWGRRAKEGEVGDTIQPASIICDTSSGFIFWEFPVRSLDGLKLKASGAVDTVFIYAKPIFVD